MKKNTIIDNELKYIDDEVYSYICKYTISKTDLYLTIAGTIGDVGEVPDRFDKMNLTENAAKLTNIICDRKYLMYTLLSTHAQAHFSSKFHQVAQPKLSIETANSTLVPIPPLHEQHRIVAEIEKMFALIDSLDENKQDLESAIATSKSKILDLAIHGKLVPQDPSDEPASELLKRINPKAATSCDNPHYENSQLPDGWIEFPISELCDSINGLWTGKRPPFVNVGVIRNANFTKDFRLDYSKIEYIDVESKAFAKRHLIDGDLIVEKSGGSDNNPVGRSILYEGPDGTYSYSNFTMVLRVQNRKLVLSKYLYYFLMAIYIRGDMRKMQTQTTGLHNLILDSFMSIMVPIPPLQEQNKIITKIETMFLALESIATILH